MNALLQTAAGLLRDEGGLRPDAAALFRVHLLYLWRHRRRLRLTAPTRFTEMVQLRKLYDRDPRMPLLADKLAVKHFVLERLGSHWVIPTLWHGTTLPAAPAWDGPFVVKSRHGCNQTLYVRTDPPAHGGKRHSFLPASHLNAISA